MNEAAAASVIKKTDYSKFVASLPHVQQIVTDRLLVSLLHHVVETQVNCCHVVCLSQSVRQRFQDHVIVHIGNSLRVAREYIGCMSVPSHSHN